MLTVGTKEAIIKSHTDVWQSNESNYQPSRQKPRERGEGGGMFTLHHWEYEVLNAAKGQGGGGPRDPMAKCIPSQGQLVG